MKKFFLVLLTFGLTPTLFCQKTMQQKLDEVMTGYTSVNKFNGSVLIAQKGKILLEKGYGIKNAQHQLPNDVNSIFQIYSVTKTFTSTVIMKLVEQGKLALTDKLSKFYPGFPKGDSITIEHLLTHTSGIYDYTRGNNMPDQTEQSFISFIKTKPLDFSPGTSWAYSNSGYWLLGFIISKVTGMSYEKAVQHYIFHPLKMQHSGFDFKHLADKNKTTGYVLFSEEVKKEAVIYDPPGPYAAGAIYSTVGDLYNYYKGLQAYKVISEASLTKAGTPFKNNYGYGWIINNYAGKEIISHSGGAAGYRSNFVRIPKEDVCIILLNNNQNANVELITKKLCDVLFDKPYEVPFEVKVNKETLLKYTGTYQVTTPPLTFYITIEGNRLAAQVPNQPKTILLAQKENYFFAEEAQGFIGFEKTDTGKVYQLLLQQGGKQFTGNRIYPSWGLIGTATAVGWNGPDIPLKQDAVKEGLWTLNNVTLTAG